MREVRIVSWNVENSLQGLLQCPLNATCSGHEVRFENTYDRDDLRTRSACFGDTTWRQGRAGEAYLIPSGGLDNTWDHQKDCRLKEVIWRKHDQGRDREYTERIEDSMPEAKKSLAMDRSRERREGERLRVRQERRAMKQHDREERPELRRERQAMEREMEQERQAMEREQQAMERRDDHSKETISCDSPYHPFLKNRERHLRDDWTPKTYVFDDSCLKEVEDLDGIPAMYLSRRMRAVAWRLGSMTRGGIAALQENDEGVTAALQRYSRESRNFRVLDFAETQETTLTFVWDPSTYQKIKTGVVSLWPVARNSEGREKDRELQRRRAARLHPASVERSRDENWKFVQPQPRPMLWGLFAPKEDTKRPTLLVGNVHFKGGMVATHKSVAAAAFKNLQTIAQQFGAIPILAGDLNDDLGDYDSGNEGNKHPMRGISSDVAWYPAEPVDWASSGIDKIFLPNKLLEDWVVTVTPETEEQERNRESAEEELKNIAAASPRVTWTHHKRGQHRLSDHAPVVLTLTSRQRVTAYASERRLDEEPDKLIRRLAQMSLKKERRRSEETRKRTPSLKERKRRRRTRSRGREQ